jgi:hypothetical protein
MALKQYKIRIDFLTIKVIKDGDAFGDGELYWDFKVDNQIILTRASNNPFDVRSGATISLNGGHEVIRNSRESLTIYGTVSESDGFLSFEDDRAGEFTDTYSETNQYWGHGNHSKRLTGDGVDVVVNYKITVLSSETIYNPDHDGGPRKFYGDNNKIKPVFK